MTHYKVVAKRIVSPDGKVIAEAKSVVETSSEGETDQSVFVNISSENSSSSYVRATSRSSSSSSSSSISSCSSSISQE
ncbi:hypothetical protein H6G41_01555 [Tolypothrix sp. FACHB-123]|uniref:hypothetical protein n=1 Tax=Tolypothrix sp. FACHB-123 TaxID=2692868 RepID=UPI001687AA70|nr:hypothetical protein [Tolypothrix sp. FACHB-123]MBD2353317.1 hypothetical protein [Tolypothrix sp. FACHB-123]